MRAELPRFWKQVGEFKGSLLSFDQHLNFSYAVIAKADLPENTSGGICASI
jgi:hypothetical protein